MGTTVCAYQVQAIMSNVLYNIEHFALQEVVNF